MATGAGVAVPIYVDKLRGLKIEENTSYYTNI
jgi:hypothetical protein